MNKLALLMHSPEQLSQRHRKGFERELANVDGASQPEEHARLTDAIRQEDEFQQSFAQFKAERKSATTRSRWSVSAKGLLQLLALAVVVFVAIGVKRAFFG